MKIFIFILALFFIVSQCFALSEKEYNEMKSQSHEYEQADIRLEIVWQRILKLAKGSKKKELIEDQRNWIKYKRDNDATEFMSNGYDKTHSYTEATVKRIKELQDVEYELYKNQMEKDREKFSLSYIKHAGLEKSKKLAIELLQKMIDFGNEQAIQYLMKIRERTGRSSGSDEPLSAMIKDLSKEEVVEIVQDIYKLYSNYKDTKEMYRAVRQANTEQNAIQAK